MFIRNELIKGRTRKKGEFTLSIEDIEEEWESECDISRTSL